MFMIIINRVDTMFYFLNYDYTDKRGLFPYV